MSGLRQTFFAAGEALFRALGNMTSGATQFFDRIADWFGERAR